MCVLYLKEMKPLAEFHKQHNGQLQIMPADISLRFHVLSDRNVVRTTARM